MLLACKYEEISVPVVEDLIQISDRAYTREEVLEMVINFFSFPFSYVSFCCNYHLTGHLFCGVVQSGEIDGEHFAV